MSARGGLNSLLLLLKKSSGSCPVLLGIVGGTLGPFHSATYLKGKTMDHEYDDNETLAEIADERREYQDNLTRSEEDGWFYPDDDGDGE